MKKIVSLLALIASLAPVTAMAEAGDIVVRLRATNVNPSTSSSLGQDTNKAYGTDTAAILYGSNNANLEVDSNTIAEIDFSYYITKNIAAELILALGTEHDVNVSGSRATGLLSKSDLGSVNLLPPTLTLQWHFMPDQMFDPYVGAGVSYIRAMNNGLNAQVGALKLPIRIDTNMWGPAIQAGFDVNLKDGWLLNFDAKKIWFDTDVKLNTLGNVLPAGYRKIDSLDIDPLVVSVGFGKRF